MKFFAQHNIKPFLNTLILSFACTFIHIFICNFGGIYNFILSQKGNFFSVLFDIIISTIIIAIAINFLFSLNYIVTKILVLLTNFVALIYSYFVVHFGIIINEQIIISALFYGEGNDVSSAFDSWIYIYVLPLFILTSFLIFLLEKKLAIKTKFSFDKLFILKYLQNIVVKITYNVILVLIIVMALNTHLAVATYKLKTFSESMMPSYLFVQYKEIKLMHKSSRNFYLEGYENYRFKNYGKTNEPLLAVILIGESLRSNRLSINGYHRETTPNLSKIPNLFSFKDVLSCATSTSASLLCMLTDENQDKWMEKFSQSRHQKKYSVAKVFKDLGFEITVLSSANKDSGIYIYKDFHAPDKIVMASELRKKYLSKYNDFGDIILLEELNNNISKNSLYILGTRGSHREYYMNYPREFAMFTPDLGHSLEEVQNSYDNTVLYFDNFLSKMIEKLRDNNAVIFYVSDHGESLGENGVFLHGAPIENAPIEQRNVPMMVWMSDKFIKNNPNEFTKIKKNNELNRQGKLQVKHDHFFHTILGCARIKSENNLSDQKLNLCN